MAGPSGVVTVPCLSNPAFVASDRSQVARRRVRLDLATFGSLNSNSTSARTSLVPKLCPVVMHSPVTGLFRVPDRFLLPTIRPRFQEQRTTGHTQSASIQHCNVWSDRLLR